MSRPIRNLAGQPPLHHWNCPRTVSCRRSEQGSRVWEMHKPQIKEHQQLNSSQRKERRLLNMGKNHVSQNDMVYLSLLVKEKTKSYWSLFPIIAVAIWHDQHWESTGTRRHSPEHQVPVPRSPPSTSCYFGSCRHQETWHWKTSTHHFSSTAPRIALQKDELPNRRTSNVPQWPWRPVVQPHLGLMEWPSAEAPTISVLEYFFAGKLTVASSPWCCSYSACRSHGYHGATNWCSHP